MNYKIGFYADDLEGYEATECQVRELSFLDEYHFISRLAKDYADEYHQIDEDSDLEFSVFVEFKGELKEVKLKTEFNPIYCVDSID